MVYFILGIVVTIVVLFIAFLALAFECKDKDRVSKFFFSERKDNREWWALYRDGLLVETIMVTKLEDGAFALKGKFYDQVDALDFYSAVEYYCKTFYNYSS